MGVSTIWYVIIYSLSSLIRVLHSDNILECWGVLDNNAFKISSIREKGKLNIDKRRRNGDWQKGILCLEIRNVNGFQTELNIWIKKKMF